MLLLFVSRLVSPVPWSSLLCVEGGTRFHRARKVGTSFQTRTPRPLLLLRVGSLYSAKIQKPPVGPISRDGKTLAMVDTGTADLHEIGEPMGPARAARRVLSARSQSEQEIRGSPGPLCSCCRSVNSELSDRLGVLKTGANMIVIAIYA